MPGFSVHGILWARILEWVGMPSSRGPSRPRDWTHITGFSCIVRRVFSLPLVPPGLFILVVLEVSIPAASVFLELVRNASSQALLYIYWVRNSGGRDSFDHNTPSEGYWCTMKFENYNLNPFSGSLLCVVMKTDCSGCIIMGSGNCS